MRLRVAWRLGRSTGRCLRPASGTSNASVSGRPFERATPNGDVLPATSARATSTTRSRARIHRRARESPRADACRVFAGAARRRQGHHDRGGLSRMPGRGGRSRAPLLSFIAAGAESVSPTRTMPRRRWRRARVVRRTFALQDLEKSATARSIPAAVARHSTPHGVPSPARLKRRTASANHPRSSRVHRRPGIVSPSATRLRTAVAVHDGLARQSLASFQG